MLQEIPYLSNLDAQHNQLHQKIGLSALGIMPTIATNSALITRDSLPPMYVQLYLNGSAASVFFNINNSIFSTVLNLK